MSSHLCRRGYATQHDRERVLDQIANQLQELGFRHMVVAGLKPKHVEGLVDRWKADGLAVGTIKNRMAELRWWAEKIGKQNVVARDTRAWREALIRAEICDFCWHDLRHTWASWHVQNGTPLHVLQELGGWSSLKMVQRYAHLSGEHLRHWIDRPKLQLAADNENLRTGTSG